ncbi:glycosyltransferase family 2 protein [Labedella endophytica]|uniref:Glycosyltransferase family 2 protein n=1 Tax=Labedella endophytica TaxID=1523160 RepID=A0A433JSN8_9MICO|nr:glycosyltransferase family 2 protein [Labedella endophytica]RUR01336.1 glycosyltransferase family 2 protein [Labedella endophytica]
MSAGRVLVVTVTYNSGDHLTSFLDSLAGASTGDLRVVISDNGSTDGAPQRESAARGGDVRVLENAENLGYGKAVNRAAAGATEDWILIVNPDVVMHPGSIDDLVAEAAARPEVGVVGPRILDGEGNTYPSARPLPRLFLGIGHGVLSTVAPNNPWSRRYRPADLAAVDHPFDTGWLSGACLLVRRDVFEAIGGFDDAFFMYFEDVDLGRRIGQAGYLCRYTPAAVVTHVGAHSTSHASTAMIRAHHRSAYTYVARVYPGTRWAPVRLALRLGLAARSRLTTRPHKS